MHRPLVAFEPSNMAGSPSAGTVPAQLLPELLLPVGGERQEQLSDVPRGLPGEVRGQPAHQHGACRRHPPSEAGRPARDSACGSRARRQRQPPRGVRHALPLHKTDLSSGSRNNRPNESMHPLFGCSSQSQEHHCADMRSATSKCYLVYTCFGMVIHVACGAHRRLSGRSARSGPGWPTLRAGASWSRARAITSAPSWPSMIPRGAW